MKPPIEYRQPRPASSSGRTPDFGSGKGGSNPSAGTNLGRKKPSPASKKVALAGLPSKLSAQPKSIAVASPLERGTEQVTEHGTPPRIDHKRALKAAQMRRYRANVKAKKAGK